MNHQEVCRQLNGYFRSDLSFGTRAAPLPSDDFLRSLNELSSTLPVVYTAFDGDHLSLSSVMRSCVFRDGKVPANPESILGYKETVMAHQTKRGVLCDDLSVLSRCDELWIFTDCQPCKSEVPLLAEGVLVELLHFLKEHPNQRIVFVPIGSALARKPVLLSYPLSLQETIAAIGPNTANKLISGGATPNTLLSPKRPLVYHILDPLDFKYSRWLQSDAYQKEVLPLIPGLAIDISDPCPDTDVPSKVLLAWLRLTKLASRAWAYPSMETGRPKSAVVQTFERFWNRQYPEKPLIWRRWEDYPIPKASTPATWALTSPHCTHK